MPFPALPRGAAYLKLSNPSRRNALSLSILEDLKAQIVGYNTSKDGELQLLPKKNARLRIELPRWLTSSEVWREERGHLPKVLVLRSEGPVFCSGHDLKEMKEQGREFTKKTFALCAEVMGLIKASPIPIVCLVQGLATAAGFQLAMATDYPIALADVKVQLPGMLIGLPCTSPATTVSRRVPPAVASRLFMTGEQMRVDELQGAIEIASLTESTEVSIEDQATLREAALERRVTSVVQRLLNVPAQPQAFGKWAFWTQLGVQDGTEMEWAGQVMVQHSAGADAREGIGAFLEKRSPSFTT